MHGAGRYELSTMHKNSLVDSSKWYSWSEEIGINHVSAFHTFIPSLSDTFKKPKTAGIKPNQRSKKGCKTPDIMQDRLSHTADHVDRTPSSSNYLHSSFSHHSPSTLEIRFPDLRSPPKRANFFRSKLSRSI